MILQAPAGTTETTENDDCARRLLKMRRWIAVILSLVLMAGFPLSAKAAAVEEVEPCGDNVMTCPRCGSIGKLLTEWWEYNYYYSRLWNQFECQNEACKFVWNTVVIEVSHLYKKNREEFSQ